ncbi:YcaO-like family protein [Pelagibius sp.]|uniref:YcaO-like family protein n=1 Tax=Pelagibius sp. TaxID=1931238 RepID=UPI00261558EF|nr:YcaO-like family protein [Pelagibius sp.]
MTEAARREQASGDSGSAVPPAAVPPGSAKVYRGGTHRSRRPEETLARVLPFARQIGITRLANVTGLDSIGIPVFMACRPLSRSIAVSQGKGLTVDEARVSAFMESAETFHAERIAKPLRMLSFNELAVSERVIDVSGLPRSRLGDFHPEQPILWIEAGHLDPRRSTSGDRGAPLWVPLELVSTNFTLPQPPGSYVFPADTNGLASGNTFEEAALHAVCELIERDALSLWRLGGDAVRAASKIDAGTVDSAAARSLLDHYAQAGLSVGLWDVTSDVGVPVFCCAVAEPSDHSVEAELGAGCHPDREVALLRALTEAAQSRTTRIAGSRDDYVPESYDSAAKLARNRTARLWLADPPRRSYGDVPNLSGADIAGDLSAVVGCLAAVGVEEVAAVDLTKPEIGIPVVRAVASGLEGAYQGEGSDYRPGRRARARGLSLPTERTGT